MKRKAGAPLHHDPDAIIAAREQAEMTQTEVARRLGVSLPLICMIEGGTRDAGPARLREFALIFGVPAETLKAKRNVRRPQDRDEDEDEPSEAAA